VNISKGKYRVKTTKVAFVTHFCPHYRVKTFETLAQRYDAEFFFYSRGNEWYGQGIHGVHGGDFRYEYLPGFQVGSHTRIAPSLVARLSRKEYAVFVKCINGRFALPATYLTARLRGIPFVLWTGVWMRLQRRSQRFGFPLTRWIYNHSDAIAVYGEHVKRYLIQEGVAPEKIFVAAHAVDNSLYSKAVSSAEKERCKAELSLTDQKVVLYLGRLEPVKGLDHLLKAFARVNLDNAALVLAGDGTLRGRLEEMAQQLGILRKTRFAGYVRPEIASRFYAVADVFVLPSITMPSEKETWGLVVNEAMNQGLPVIATDAVGAAAGGLVQSGANGFVVPECDSDALAEAIERVLNDDTLRHTLSANARKIIATWDNDRMVKGFQHAIEYALRQRRRAPEAAASFRAA
jgi:glycosyltransferase involved in cell wall biosynthesis